MSRLRKCLLSGVVFATSVVVVVSIAGLQVATIAGEPQAKNAHREVHAVGIYEGGTKTGNRIHGGKAVVTVDRPGKFVTLILSSYDPVTWQVNVSRYSRVERVILGGYHRQAVTGVPKNIEVVEAFREGESSPKMVLYLGYEMSTPRFRNVLRQLVELTGMELSSFQGSYQGSPDKPFVVDRIEDTPMLSSDYPQPTPLSELPKLSFKALHFTHGLRPYRAYTAYGDFTLGGPEPDTFQPVPSRITRLAFDPVGQKCYGLSDHEIFEVSLNENRATQLDLSLDVPRLSWPCGIAFDGKRDRLLVASRGGEGYLYEYQPASGNWKVLSSLHNLDLAALEYSPAEDALFGIGQPRAEAAKPVLYQFNAKGAIVKKTELSAPMLPGSLGRVPVGPPTQIVAVEKYLVVLASPSRLSSSRSLLPKKRMYLIDPKTGRAWMTWKEGSRETEKADP